MNDKFKTPILFLTFNRFDTTRKVFKKIKSIKPSKLYLASDGPRNNNQKEKETVDKIRKWILANIDWECELETLFRNENLGCKVAVSNSLNWFFQNEEFGIILEDDVVPNHSFFRFCEEMLLKYREDERIMMIGGTNYFLETSKNNEDYFFSKQFTIWGWATWRRAWNLYDVNMKTWNITIGIEELNYLLPAKNVSKYWAHYFNLVQDGKIDTWDIQWVYTCLINNGLSIIPHKNLISNIGLDGAHANGAITDSHFIKTFEFPKNQTFCPPNGMYPSNNYDYLLNSRKILPAYRKIVLLKLLKALRLENKLKFIYKAILFKR